MHLNAQHSPILITTTIHLDDDQNYVRSIVDETGKTVALVLSDPDNEWDNDDEQSASEQLALVMAAAPDLLESLTNIVDMFERHINGLFGPDDAAARYDRARAALAKAVGRES